MHWKRSSEARTIVDFGDLERLVVIGNITIVSTNPTDSLVYYVSP